MTQEKKMAAKIFRPLIPLIILSIILLSLYVTALPTQPVITPISNETSASVGIGAESAGDKGGYITTVTLNASQQNFAWKAYIGNVTGELVLQDTDSNSIYKWSMDLNAVGNVYISRNGTVTWGGINCSDRGNITAEDDYLGLDSETSKSINQTFSTSVHKAFKVSGNDYIASNCPAISTYVSGASQGPANEADLFQEVLLADSASNLVYMTILEPDQVGFDGGVYDFQALVAENEGLAITSPTTYYFYLELL